MMGQPSDQQNSDKDFKSVLISTSAALPLQVVEAEVAFEHGKEAFNIAAFALVTAELLDPCPGQEEALAGFTGIDNDFRGSVQAGDNESQNGFGEVGGIGPHHLYRKGKQPLCQHHQRDRPGRIVAIGRGEQHHEW